MAASKTLQSDLRKRYHIHVKFSLVFALLILIILFKFAPDPARVIQVTHDDPEIFNLIPEVKTRQDLPKTPPPPQPAILIAQVFDNPLNDLLFGDTQIDLKANLDKPPLPDNKVYVDDSYDFYKFSEIMPEPVGGIAAIQNRITYPDLAIKIGLESKVYVEAYVDEQGKVVKAQVVNEVPEIFINEAVKAVLETKFLPGRQGNKPVKVRVTIPIKFILK